MKATRAFKLANCQILPIEFSIQFDDCEKQSLQPKFVEVLSYLATHYPRIIPREELIENVWDGNVYVGEKALTNAIWHLRKCLKDTDCESEVIETIRKSGYRLLVSPQWQEEPAKMLPPSEFSGNSAVTDSSVKPSSPWLKYIPYIMISLLILLVFWLFINRVPTFYESKVTQVTKVPGSELFVSPSPDGRYIVYQWVSPDGGTNLYMQDRQQPQLAATQLTFDDHIEGFSVWSNDGEYLYFSRKNSSNSTCEIIQMKVTSNQEKFITKCSHTGRYYYIDISPDGKVLAYQGYNEPADDSGIYFIRLDHEEAQPYRFSCANNCGYRDRDMAFSPDGKKIAISRRFNDYKENIFLIDLKTNTELQLTEGEEDIVGLTWHPDNKKIIYATQRADVRRGYILDIATKQHQELNIDGFSYPEFAKKSKQLFYQQRYEKYHIASLQLNESIASSAFPVVQSDYNHSYPDYSSLAKKFIYVSNESGYYELWSANSDGNNRTQLTHLEQTIHYPNWSHDGTKVAFIAPHEGDIGDSIYILEISSLKITTLLSPFKEHNRPTWSYDDKAIISAIYDHDFTDLYQISIADGESKRLTFDGGRYGFMTSATTMLYTRLRAGLWQINIDTNSTPLNRVSGKLMKTRYTWTHHNDSIYFRQDAAGHHQISHYDFNQLQLTPLVRLPKHTFGDFGSITLIPELNKLLFTGSAHPQSDIKLLEHPLLD